MGHILKLMGFSSRLCAGWEVGGLGAYFEANGVFQPTVCWAERRRGAGVMLRDWLGGFSSAGMRGCWAQG